MKIQINNTPAPEHGYILLMTAVFLFMLVASSAHFFYRTTENTSMTGISRDSSKSLLLAESAMEHLRGKFVRNRMNTDNITRVTECIVDAATSDTCESSAIVANMDNPEASMFNYMYYISSADALENTTPQLLQRIANGESEIFANSQLNNRKVAAATTRLRINDLFNTGSDLQPRLYILSENSRLTASAADSWDAETSPEKAAAWIEVIVNPDNPASVDLIVQAVGQVGKTKSYLQRFAGNFSTRGLIGAISLLTGASNLDRT